MSNTAKSCKAGYYYCFTDKSVRRSHSVGMSCGGYLSRDDEDDSEKRTVMEMVTVVMETVVPKAVTAEEMVAGEWEKVGAQNIRSL